MPDADYAHDRLRCPQCGSDQCECTEDSTGHTHVCGDCGLTQTWKGRGSHFDSQEDKP